jgi:hypothetical protein
MEKKDSPTESEFTRQATAKRSSFLSDYVYLVKRNRKWWMLPLMGILLGFGLLMVLASTGAAPFIYTMF